MMHSKLGGQPFTGWFVRFISIYLCLFWGILYLDFSLNSEVGPLAFRDMLKSVYIRSYFRNAFVCKHFSKERAFKFGGGLLSSNDVRGLWIYDFREVGFHLPSWVSWAYGWSGIFIQV